MGGKKKKTTIGYKYYMGLFMGLCRGPVDAIRQIRVGDKTAWSGHATSNSSITINKPDLFGGEEQEGGIDGTLQVMLGAPTQPRNESLAAMLGGLVSAFRGVTTTFFDGLVCAMSPYPKEWSYLVQKTKAGWHKDECWYPAKCEIVLLGGEVQLLGSGWEYCIEHFTEPNTVWNNFTPPTTGWAQGGEMPFSTNGKLGGTYWTPTRSNIWLRRKMQVKALGLTLKIGADNGCMVWVNGTPIGSSNPTNANIDANENNPVSYEFRAVGTVDVLIKAYAEIDLASEGGNIVNVSFTGGSLIAMNPAHILRRLYTDPSIGRGLNAALRLDEESWAAAADTFFKEGLGLCMKWSRSGSVANFAGEVINHAGAAVYTSRRTGKIVLKAIRGDYDLNDLPLFTPDTGLLGFDDDVASAQTSGINEIVVNWTNVLEKTDAAVREKNLGAIMAAGGVAVTESVDYPGIPTESLARRIARRDLKAKSGFIKRLSVRLDRRGRNIMPGHVFRVSDPSRGIENMVLRAGRVEFGTITDGAVTVTALQDVFGLPATVYREPEENAYVPPDNTPRIPAIQGVMEAPYRELVQAMSTADLAALSPDAGFLSAMAVRPAGLTASFQLMTRAGSADFTTAVERGAWCPGGTLSAEIGPLDTSVVLVDAVDLNLVAVGTAALIGDEIVRIDAVNPDTSMLTIGRGCIDTVPSSHAANTTVLCYDTWGADDLTEYIHGVTVSAKLLTQTGSGTLPLEIAPEKTATFSGRAARPYPPGNVQLNGEHYPVQLSGDVSLSWTHRDRTLQADKLVDTLQGSIGPEPGSSYTLEVYDAGTDALLHSETGIGSTSVIIPTEVLTYQNRIELYAVRAGIESWQRQIRMFKFGSEILGTIHSTANLESYHAQLTAAGQGTWSIVAGRLPMGLHLDADTGAISGVANDAEGYYTATVRFATSAGHVSVRAIEIGLSSYITLLPLDSPAGVTAITDKTGKTWARTGSPVFSNVTAKFGSTSLNLGTNTNWYYQTPSSADMALGDQDFTMAAWVYNTSRTANWRGILGKRASSSSTASFAWMTDGVSPGQLMFESSTNGSNITGPKVNSSASGIAPSSTWSHVVVARRGATMKMFIDGRQADEVQGNAQAIYNSTAPLQLGKASNLGTQDGCWNGYMQEVSIQKGAARFWEEFTPPEMQSDYPQPAPALAITGSLPAGRVGTPYSSTTHITVLGSATAVAVTAGSLPSGWMASVSGPHIEVTGIGAAAGYYTATLTVTDNAGNTASLPLTVMVGES